jgi:hypothetical protein
MSIELTPDELKTASRIADNLAYRFPGILEPAELVSAMTLWMLEHPDTVRQLREAERGLYTTLRRTAMRAINTERAYLRGYDPSDQFKYPAGLLFELLQQALPLDRDLSEAYEKVVVKSHNKSDPAFGGERIVMLIDVRAAMERLTPMMAQRIHEAVAEDFDYNVLAEMWTTEEKPVTADAARLRVKRAIRNLSDLLSEPRTEQEVDREYTGSRQVVSNARAQGAIAVGAAVPTAARSPWLEGGILS